MTTHPVSGLPVANLWHSTDMSEQKLNRTDRGFAIFTVVLFAAMEWAIYRVLGLNAALAVMGASFVLMTFRMFRLAFQVAWLRDDYVKQKDELLALRRQFVDFRQGNQELMFVVLAEKYPYAFRGPDMIVRFPSGDKIAIPATDFLRFKCINPDMGVGGLDVVTGAEMFDVLQRNVGHQYEDRSEPVNR